MYPSNKQKQKEFDEHHRLALYLLNGAEERDKHGVDRRVFLSANTKPTEEEARRALCRILRYWERCTGANLLGAIANVFDPNGNGERKVVFKKLTQGHSDPVRNDSIATMVYFTLHDFPEEGDHFRNNTTFREAYDAVANRVGLTPEQVKKIFRRDRKNWSQKTF